MSDEVGEAKAGEATVNENQKFATQEEQITKPAPKVKPQRKKIPRSRRWEKAGRKKQTSKSSTRARNKTRNSRERTGNENSAGWLPEMSFQTVLSIVGIAFTAFELYQRFRQKESSVSVQSTISPRAEPKHSGGDRESGEAAGAKLGAERSDSGAGGEAGAKLGESQAPTSETPRSPVSSKIGMT